MIFFFVRIQIHSPCTSVRDSGKLDYNLLVSHGGESLSGGPGDVLFRMCTKRQRQPEPRQNEEDEYAGARA